MGQASLLDKLLSEWASPYTRHFYRADGPLSHSLDNLSSKWAWPIHSTVCRVNGPRRVNGSERKQQTTSWCRHRLKTNHVIQAFYISDFLATIHQYSSLVSEQAREQNLSHGMTPEFRQSGLTQTKPTLFLLPHLTASLSPTYAKITPLLPFGIKYPRIKQFMLNQISIAGTPCPASSTLPSFA